MPQIRVSVRYHNFPTAARAFMRSLLVVGMAFAALSGCVPAEAPQTAVLAASPTSTVLETATEQATAAAATATPLPASPSPVPASATSTVRPTSRPTLRPTQVRPTPSVAATAVLSPTPVETAEVLPPESIMTFVPPEIPYTLTVSYAIADFPSDYPAPPSGSQWVVVVASILNSSDEAVDVAADSIELVDEAGNAYPTAEADEFTSPSLVGTTVPPGVSLQGVVRFAVPVNTVAGSLRWCLDAECARSVEGRIP